MTISTDALIKAIQTALLADEGLCKLLEGPHVYVTPPDVPKKPMIIFGQNETREWALKGSISHEHFVVLNILTENLIRAQVDEIGDRVEEILVDAELDLDGHKLVNIRMPFRSSGKGFVDECYFGTMRFRASTEPFERTMI